MVEENSVLLILPFQSSIKFISGEWQGALMSEQVCQSQKRINFVAASSLQFATFSINEVPWFWAHYQEFVGVKENKKGVKKRINFVANSHWSGEGWNIFDQWGALIISTLQRVKWCKFFRSFCPKRHEWHKWHVCKIFLGSGILFKN